MSIVAAIKDKTTGTVWMSCDSQSTQGQRKSMIKSSKIVQKGQFLFGCVGNPLLSQIIEAHLELPEWPKGLEARDYLIKILFPVLHKLIQGHDTRTSNSIDSDDLYCLLIACHGHIFNVGEALVLDEYDAEFDAVGAGEDYALGAFEGILAFNNVQDFEAIVRVAAEAAVKHNATCGGQIKIYHTIPPAKPVKGKAVKGKA